MLIKIQTHPVSYVSAALPVRSVIPAYFSFDVTSVNTHRPLRVRINIAGDARMRALSRPRWVCTEDARAALKMESVSVLAALVEEERARFPSGAPGKFVYGTAGFRDK